MSDNDALAAGLEAMLDGNKVRFADIVDSILADKAAEVVDAMRNDYQTQVFDFTAEEAEDEVEEVEDETKEESESEDQE